MSTWEGQGQGVAGVVDIWLKFQGTVVSSAIFPPPADRLEACLLHPTIYLCLP